MCFSRFCPTFQWSPTLQINIREEGSILKLERNLPWVHLYTLKSILHPLRGSAYCLWKKKPSKSWLRQFDPPFSETRSAHLTFQDFWSKYSSSCLANVPKAKSVQPISISGLAVPPGPHTPNQPSILAPFCPVLASWPIEPLPCPIPPLFSVGRLGHEVQGPTLRSGSSTNLAAVGFFPPSSSSSSRVLHRSSRVLHKPDPETSSETSQETSITCTTETRKTGGSTTETRVPSRHQLFALKQL